MAASDWTNLRARIGSTPLRPAPTLGRQLRIPNLFVKDEGANPAGSITDRLAAAHVDAALALRLDTIAVAADGPETRSYATLAHAAGLRVVVHTPSKAGPQWAHAAEAEQARVLRAGDDLVEAREASQAAAVANGWYDANPTEASRTLRIEAYAAMAHEFGGKNQAAVVAVPTREGSVIAGLWNGFERAPAGRPKLLAATTKMGNPILFALAENRNRCQDLDPNQVWPSETSATLATYKATDGTPCVAAVRASGGWAFGASDQELVSLAHQAARAESIETLPAAAAGLAALHFAAKFGKLNDSDRHVAVLSAHP